MLVTAQEGKELIEYVMNEKEHLYNPFDNILRFFDVLPNFPFTTSVTKGDY